MSDRTHVVNYDAAGAERVEANLDLNVGHLQLEGGAEKVVQAEFGYTHDEWKPDVHYEVREGVGYFTASNDFDGRQIRVPNMKNLNIKNHWNIRFNNTMPLDLTIGANAAALDLSLSDLTLRGVDIELNASRLDVALAGEHPALQQAALEANAGHINLAVSGAFPELEVLDIEMNAVKAMLDLSGEWTASQNIALEANAGWVSVRLPRHIGVQIFTESTLTMIHHTGLTKKNGAYVNEAFGVAPVTLRLDVVANVGRIEFLPTEKIDVVTPV